MNTPLTVMAGQKREARLFLDFPAIHGLFSNLKTGVDARVICAKTRFALLPGHDEKIAAPKSKAP